MAVYLTAVPDVPIQKIVVVALIGGVSGATYFTKNREVKEARGQVRKEKAKSKALKKTSELALEPSVKEEGDNGTK